MRLLSRGNQRVERLEQVNLQVRQTLAELERIVMGENDEGEITVNPDTAMKCPTVHSCVRILSETVAQLPFHLYERKANGGRDRLSDNPLDKALNRIANRSTTAFNFRKQAMTDLCLWGNAYARIVRNRQKEVIELHRLPPRSVIVKRNETTQEPEYEVSRKAGGNITYSHADVFHLQWLSTDGLVGESPVLLAQEAIRLAMGLEKYASTIMKKGGRPIGYLKAIDPNMKDGPLEKLKDAFLTVFQGKGKAAEQIPIIAKADFVKVAFNAVEMELQHLRNQQTTFILSVYRMPPPFVSEYGTMNYSNAEHAGSSFVAFTLMPFLKMWEAEIYLKCLTEEDRKKFYAEFLVDDLTRADIEARYKAYALGRTGEWLSANDVRAKENMPGIGTAGDRYENPNTKAAGTATDPTKTDTPDDDEDDRDAA